MPYIASYSFGRIEIDRKSYSKDIIILPDGTLVTPWWRRQGHCLEISDLEQLLSTGPGIIIAGTGASGLMLPAPGLREYLARQAIEFIVQPTADAVHTYNRLSGTGKTGACFHLTC
ncbi:MAG: MTH938/NDUFAF3 family protein [Desulfobulbaceae bacterium]|nr:MTH938/NDUFAF3 family protein [Desulfobulbaceae bacterium]